MTDEKRTIVIKKIKKHNRHHGGAWKIAYADFVTAMMAFFLLMWLLGATTQEQLQGLSEYFQTPIKSELNKASGSGDRSSVIQGVALFATMVLAGPWMLSVMVDYMRQVLEGIPAMVR